MVSRGGESRVAQTAAALKVAAFVAQLPPCLIGIEAGNGAHYWARVLQQYGPRSNSSALNM